MKKGGESKVKGIKCKVKERENDGGGGVNGKGKGGGVKGGNWF